MGSLIFRPVLERYSVRLSFAAPAFGRYEFIIRRLHSLTGLVPVGAYLAFHLATNASILDGLDAYQTRVDQIAGLGPTTIFLLEWPFIFLPIIFHAVIGILIVCRGERNVGSYPYLGNIRYTLQRWTGVIAFVFIFWHVFHMHGWLRFSWWHEGVARRFGGAQFDPADAFTAAAGHPGLVVGASALYDRRACERLPSGQRHLDVRHHLGHLDQPARAAVGERALPGHWGVSGGVGRSLAGGHGDGRAARPIRPDADRGSAVRAGGSPSSVFPGVQRSAGRHGSIPSAVIPTARTDTGFRAWQTPGSQSLAADWQDWRPR